MREVVLDEDRRLLSSADGRAEIQRHHARRVVPQIVADLLAVELDDLDVIVGRVIVGRERDDIDVR